jgi:hypothetical protein
MLNWAHELANADRYRQQGLVRLVGPARPIIKQARAA